MLTKNKKKVITIDGMVRDHCKTKVEKALSVLDGVTKVKINLHDKRKEKKWKDFLFTQICLQTQLRF